MKKIFFLIGLIPIMIFGQSYTWHDSINAADVTTDTVIQPEKVGESGNWSKNIANFGCSCTFWLDYLTDTVTVNLGGSNHQYTLGKYSFAGFSSDSLPYVLVKLDHPSITNSDTSYIKDMSLEPYDYGKKLPQIKVTFDATDNTSALTWDCLFYKR
jgi:hypothetical protein